MDTLLDSDFYEIEVASIISNIDKDVLLDLYQPLVGALPVVLFLNLYKQGKEEDDVFLTKDLLITMKVSHGQLLDARKKLEALGLLKTFVNEKNSSRYFIYQLFAPKNPSDFFNNVLFSGLLVNAIGEKEAKKLAFKYQVRHLINDSYSDITAEFNEVYRMGDLNPKAFNVDLGVQTLGKKDGKVITPFNLDRFLKLIAMKTQINSKSLLKDDLAEIERISTLFNIDEEAMVFIVNDVFNPTSKKHLDKELLFNATLRSLDFPAVKRNGNENGKLPTYMGNSKLAQKIFACEKHSPYKFLALKQNNTKPADADVRIANSLSRNFNFTYPVINVLIDYTLEKNNNVLKKEYIEKVAATLAREGNILTAYDAMNFLKAYENEMKLRKTRSNGAIKTKEEEPLISEADETTQKKQISSNERKELSEDEKKELAELLSKMRK